MQTSQHILRTFLSWMCTCGWKRKGSCMDRGASNPLRSHKELMKEGSTLHLDCRLYTHEYTIQSRQWLHTTRLLDHSQQEGFEKRGFLVMGMRVQLGKVLKPCPFLREIPEETHVILHVSKHRITLSSTLFSLIDASRWKAEEWLSGKKRVAAYFRGLSYQLFLPMGWVEVRGGRGG